MPSPLFDEIVALAAANPLHQRHPQRKADFQHPKAGKSLLKASSRFSRLSIQTAPLGSNGSEGEHKKEKANGRSSLYYLACRESMREYYIYEIINMLGLNVPKTRIIREDLTLLILTKSIPNFIPMEAILGGDDETDATLRNKKNYSYYVRSSKNQYDLHASKQQILGLKNNRFYPVRGHLFASNLIADFLQDVDAGLEQRNACVSKAEKYNLFNFFLIDKQCAHWEPIKNNELACKFSYDKMPLARTATSEQRFAFLYQIANLFVEQDGQSNIIKIFFNPRSLTLLPFYTMDQCYLAYINALMDERWTSVVDSPQENMASFFMNLRMELPNMVPTSNLTPENYAAFTKEVHAILHTKIVEYLKEQKFDLEKIELLESLFNEYKWLWDCLDEINNMKSVADFLFGRHIKNSDEFKAYIEREKIREQLADKVLAQIQLPDDISLEMAKKNLCEDLRGNRFKLTTPDDLGNQLLIEQLIMEVKQEYELVSTSVSPTY